MKASGADLETVRGSAVFYEEGFGVPKGFVLTLEKRNFIRISILQIPYAP
jgi:hypothetical protein